MKAIKDWDNVQAAGGTFPTLPAGGYVCEIKAVTEKPNRNSPGTHLEVMFDISEGEYAGFFMKDWKANTREDKFWRGTINQNVPDEASPKYEMQAGFFKRFIQNVEESNPGYAWNWDEKTLANKKIGVIFSEREKQSQKGTIYTVTNANGTATVDQIRSGDYRIPEIKRLAPSPVAAADPWGDLPSVEDKDADFPF